MDGQMNAGSDGGQGWVGRSRGVVRRGQATETRRWSGQDGETRTGQSLWLDDVRLEGAV